MRPFFGWRDHAFRRSALSSSVPLDGSETVIGLRQWNRHLRGKDLNDYLQTNLAGLQGLSRNGYRYYKGPYLHQLSKADLQHLPVPWLLTLCGGDLCSWALAYNLPEHSAMLQERVEENFVRYRGNYIRLAAAVALLVTVLRPWALFGILCLCTLFYLNTAQPLEGLAITHTFERFTDSLVPAELHGASAQSRLHGAATVLLYILTLYSSCFTMLPRCMLSAICVVLLHASLRRAGSEYGFHYESHVKLPTAATSDEQPDAASPQRQAYIASEASARAAAVAESERLGKQLKPGFNFHEVWRGPQNGAQDPRRLLREIWQGTKWSGRFLAGTCGRLVHYYWLDAKDRIRNWRWGL